jgi:protein required for attachment to host cells
MISRYSSPCGISLDRSSWRLRWVVVCDGRKALILENIGNQAFPNLRTNEIREHTQRRTSAQGFDAPGRVH